MSAYEVVSLPLIGIFLYLFVREMSKNRDLTDSLIELRERYEEKCEEAYMLREKLEERK